MFLLPSGKIENIGEVDFEGLKEFEIKPDSKKDNFSITIKFDEEGSTKKINDFLYRMFGREPVCYCGKCNGTGKFESIKCDLCNGTGDQRKV